MMRVANHGGHCCGIKHIHEFPWAPTLMCSALPERKVHQGAAGEMTAGTDFYPGPRPPETGAERLQALLDYIDPKKEDHLIEVVLTSTAAGQWMEELRKHHFKLVTEFVNGNTHSKLCVFHRVIVDGKPKKVRFTEAK